MSASKNILLVIDPQNDFTDASYTNHDGSKSKFGDLYLGKLCVGGASGDYERLITLLDTNGKDFNEIHVSLDTHTEKHIGHPKFWKQYDGNDIPYSIFILSIDNVLPRARSIFSDTKNLPGFE